MVQMAESLFGLTGDPCDCYNYYQCDSDAAGNVYGIQRTCPDCEIWSQDVVSCVLDGSQPNCTYMPSTEGIGMAVISAVKLYHFQTYLVRACTRSFDDADTLSITDLVDNHDHHKRCGRRNILIVGLYYILFCFCTSGLP